jgi:mannosyl-3-phosphoglycerate phosphatase
MTTSALILSDLDGTLLDAETYSWRGAAAALSMMARHQIPLIPCTSKTRAEVEVLRSALAHRDPFIVENGGALYIPKDCFDATIDGAMERGEYQVLEFGVPYASLVSMLAAAIRASGVHARGFHDMRIEEVAQRCGLDRDGAMLAVQREYDEPFVIDHEDGESVARLATAIAAQGGRLMRGGRFFHVTGGHDKASASRAIVDLYRRHWRHVFVIACGDAPNDLPLFEVADAVIIGQSPHAIDLQQRFRHARITREPGPAGWNDAVLEVLRERVTSDQ